MEKLQETVVMVDNNETGEVYKAGSNTISLMLSQKTEVNNKK
jgi:hypothetical protein